MDPQALAWVQIVSNLGLPIALVIYLLGVRDPAQRKKEQDDQKNFQEVLKTALKDQRSDFETSKEKDRETSLEITRLTGEIQTRIHQGLEKAIEGCNDNVGESKSILIRLENKLDRALEEFRNNRK